MKELGKLQINSEKIMKNEELISLRGGYDEPCGRHCTSDSQCYFPCQKCNAVPGYPDSKVCTSP